MNKKIYLYIIISLLLLNHNLYALGVLGKVLIYQDESTPPKINPIFDGDGINYPGKYIITLSGATIVAKPGTKMSASQESDVTVLNITQGNVKFRIDPSQIRISFRTPYGEVYTPLIYPSSSGLIDGEILVKDSTILELNEGVMESRTLNGNVTIRSGQAVLLSQADRT